MDHAQQCHSHCTDRLCKGLLASCLDTLDTYTRYLTERGYVRRTIHGYHACLADFSQWVYHRRQAVRRVDKALIAKVIDEQASEARRDWPSTRPDLFHSILEAHKRRLRDLPAIRRYPWSTTERGYKHLFFTMLAPTHLSEFAYKFVTAEQLVAHLNASCNTTH